MFGIESHVDMMQVDNPSGEAPFSLMAMPPTPINYQISIAAAQTRTPPDGETDTTCAEPPKAKQLGKPIWHSRDESPEDFFDFGELESDREKVFSTPQLVSTQHATLRHKRTTQKLYNAWLGTSTVSDPDWVTAKSKTLLDEIISRRGAAEADIQRSPYDPQKWFLLANIYFELRFSDLQVASAHKALFLANCGLDANDRFLGQRVRDAVGKRLGCPFEAVVSDDLLHARLQAFKAQLRGFWDLNANWDGLKEAENALKIFPDDEDLVYMQSMLKEEFNKTAAALREISASSKDAKYISRIGRTYKRPYPWLKEKLFFRAPEFLNEVNKDFNSTNCEVRRLVGKEHRRSERLAAKASKGQLSSDGEDLDVGPLGVFATRDISKDEIILIDKSLTVVPVTPPKKLQHCDACHALLSLPFYEGEIKRPTCCKDVAYCSQECLDAATTGYHGVLCRKDFRWVYSSTASKALDPSWTPGTFLRILAVVVADQKSNPKMHPLEHPILARLTAGYSNSPPKATEQNWNYFSHVVCPTRILAQLGVDVVADPMWSAEVIHTIYWRIMTNACRTTSCTIKDGRLERAALSGIGPSYMMFNHSCDASVTWNSAGSVEGVMKIGSSSSLGETQRGNGKSGEVPGMKVGCNALLCVAIKDIKNGEEARISYLPPGHEAQLGRWFDGGRCICGACDGVTE